MTRSPQKQTQTQTSIAWTGLAISMALAIVGFEQVGSAQVPTKGVFTAQQDCVATQAIEGKNPGSVRLTIGQQYESVGFNSDRRTYILLRVPNAAPAQRWVNVDCGEFQAGTATPGTGKKPTQNPPSSTGGKRPRNQALLPFFDTISNPIPVENTSENRDITPPPPKLEAFDQNILQLCGAEFDAPVSEQDFKRLIGYYPDLVRKLKQATNGAIFANRSSDPEFLDDLGTIWFKYKGFKHIFCGEKSGKGIGGLHFVGRYLEFQEKGTGGRIERTSSGQDAKEEVVEGSIYTFGVAIKQGDRIIAEQPIKGYGYVSNAAEMLVDGTRAFKLFNVPKGTPADQSIACLYTVNDPAVPPFQAVFVKKGNAIRTFYPDATPEDSRTVGACQ